MPTVQQVYGDHVKKKKRKKSMLESESFSLEGRDLHCWMIPRISERQLKDFLLLYASERVVAVLV